MMVDLITNIASETLRSLYVITLVTGLAIILSKKPCFFFQKQHLLLKEEQAI